MPAKSSALVALAAAILSIGTAPRDPTIGAWAAIVAFVLAILALTRPSRRRRPDSDQMPILVILIAVIAIQLLVLLSAPAIPDPVFVAGIACTGLLGSAAIVSSRLRTPALLGAVLAQVLAGGWMVLSTVPNANDVYFFHQISAEALLAGQNPYSLQYPNIYGLGTPLYASEVQVGNHVTFGYPYPPLSLLMALPGYAVGGDYRLAAVVAIAVTALLAYSAAPSRIAAAVAVLILVSPLSMRMLYWGWTESFVGAMFAVTAVAAIRAPAALPWCLGLFVGVKQYVAPVLLLAAVLLREPRREFGWWGLFWMPAIIATAIMLPFLLWSPADFIFDIVVLQALQPFRIDAASIPGLIARAGGPELPTLLAFVSGALATALVLWRTQRTPAGWAMAGAVVLLAFFLMSKQAFMNYYYFVFVLLAFGVVLSSVRHPDPATVVA